MFPDLTPEASEAGGELVGMTEDIVPEYLAQLSVDYKDIESGDDIAKHDAAYDRINNL